MNRRDTSLVLGALETAASSEDELAAAYTFYGKIKPEGRAAQRLAARYRKLASRIREDHARKVKPCPKKRP